MELVEDTPKAEIGMGIKVAYAILGVLAVAMVLLVALGQTDLHILKSLLPDSSTLSSGVSFTSLWGTVGQIAHDVQYVALAIACVTGIGVFAMFAGGHQGAHAHGMRIGFGVIGLCLIGVIIA